MVSSRILVILWSVAAILVLTAACGREVPSRQDGVSVRGRYYGRQAGGAGGKPRFWELSTGDSCNGHRHGYRGAGFGYH